MSALPKARSDVDITDAIDWQMHAMKRNWPDWAYFLRMTAAVRHHRTIIKAGNERAFPARESLSSRGLDHAVLDRRNLARTGHQQHDHPPEPYCVRAV
jgi:hypothetical protein